MGATALGHPRPIASLQKGVGLHGSNSRSDGRTSGCVYQDFLLKRIGVEHPLESRDTDLQVTGGLPLRESAGKYLSPNRAPGPTGSRDVLGGTITHDGVRRSLMPAQHDARGAFGAKRLEPL